MNESSQPTRMVKKSNIGFLLGILVVVGLGVYLLRSGILTKKAAVVPSPSPSASPLTQVTEEPITLLEEEPEVAVATKRETEIHQPVDTAMGDNPMYLLAWLFGSAGITYLISQKLNTTLR